MVQSHPQNSIYIYLKKVDICVAKTWKTQQSAVLKSWNDQNRDTPMKPVVFRVATREDAKSIKKKIPVAPEMVVLRRTITPTSQSSALIQPQQDHHSDGSTSRI